MNNEPVVIYVQLDSGVDQAQRHYHQQRRYAQQYQRGACQVAVQIPDQVLLISHLAYRLHLLQFLLYPQQAVVIGVVGLHAQLH